MIRAPAAGTVLTGQLDQREEGETVLEMAQTDEWQVRIMVKETDLLKIEIGQPARLYVNAFPQRETADPQQVVPRLEPADLPNWRGV